MTCIAAVTNGRTVWMAGDSAGIAGYDVAVRRDAKVFINGSYLIGFTGSFRMGQLLRFRFNPSPPNGDLFEHMVTRFIEETRECLKAGGYARKDKEEESGGTFLVGVHGRIFQVEGDYQVGESRSPYDAIGCGASVALGALYASEHLGASFERLETALRAASHFNAGVRPPFVKEVIGTTVCPSSPSSLPLPSG